MVANNRIILFALVLGTFMTALDATIVTVALPEMAAELGEEGHNTSNISWVLLIYTMMLCCFIMLWSKISTKIGYRRLFITGIAIFTFSSLAIGLCGFDANIGLGAIIALRAVQGLGAGMTVAMSLVMVTTYLPPEIRGASLGMVTLASSAGTAFGPALGGILTTIHWSFIFFINVPIGLLCIALCLRFMDTSCEKRPIETTNMDYVGSALMLVMMSTFIYYLNKGSEIGWSSNTGVLLISISGLAAGLLIYHERRCTNPLLPMRLLGEKDIVRPVLASAILYMAMAGSYFLLPYFFQFVQDYKTIEYGFILIANSVGIMATGPIAGRIADKTGNCRIFVISGCIVCAIGFFLMMEFSESTPLWYILISLFVMGAGVGLALGSSTNLAFGYLKEGENSLLSGLTNTARQAGSSIGVAVIQAVLTAFIVIEPGLSVGEMLMPGFRHAFFVAMLFCIVALIFAMGSRDAKETS